MVAASLDGNGLAQRRFVRPLLTQRWFAEWEAILSTPPLETGHPFVDGIGHFLRGSALAAVGDLDGADEKLSLTREAAQADGMDSLMTRVAPAQRLLNVATQVLSGEIAARRGDIEGALLHLETAVRLEDALQYMEPPDWGYPARQ